MASKNPIYQSFVNPCIAVLLPFSFIMTTLFIIRDITGGYYQINLFQSLLIFLSALFRVIMDKIFLKERAGVLSLIREFILLMPLYYLVYSLLQKGITGNLFFPQVHNITPFILTVFQWCLTTFLLRNFRLAELFMNLTDSKTGKELEDTIKRGASLSLKAYGTLKQNRSFLFKLIIYLFIPFFIALLAETRIGFDTVIWALLSLAAVLTAHMLISMQMEEHTHMGYGAKILDGVRERRFLYTLLFLITCSLFSLSISQNTALLELPKIQFAPIPMATSEPEQWKPGNSQWENQEGEKIDLFQIKPSVLQENRIYIIILLAGLLGGVLLFPLFSPEFRKYLSPKKLIRYLKEKIRRIGTVLKALQKQAADFFKRKGQRKSRTLPTDNPPSPFPAKTFQGEQKKKQRRKMVRLFYKLVRWGKKQGHPFTPGHTLQEYAVILGNGRPACKPELQRIIEILEISLFSTIIIDTPTEKEYRESIKKIIRRRI